MITLEGESLDRISKVEHKIAQMEDLPVIYKRQYQLSHSQLLEVDTLVDGMAELNVIEPNNSC